MSNTDQNKDYFAKGSFKLDEGVLLEREELNAKVISTIQDERENKSTIIHSNIMHSQSEDEEEQLDQIDEDPKEEKKGSKLVFFIICLTNILINIDHGIVPAATQQIKEDLNIGDSELGFLGSLVYFGIVSAGFIAGKIYMKFPSKYVMIAAIMCMVALLFLFTYIEEVNALYFIRFITGATQVFLLVYFPVWVDLYGREKKTIWLTLLQVGVPVGVFAGYAITAVLPKSMGWRWAIYIQCMSMAPTLLVFIFCKQQDIEVNAAKFYKEPLIDITSSEEDAIKSDKLYIRSPSLYEILVVDGNEVKIKKENKQKEKKDKKKKKGFFQLMSILWRSKIYVAALLTIALLYFVVTGIQFWMSDYFRVVLNADENLVFGTYSFVSLTGPTLGVIFGGILTQKIGGYDHQNAKIMCIIFAVISASVACPMPFIDAFYASASLVWLLLFFGGAMVPALTGMMLSAIQVELRAFANSNSQTVQNLLGFLPAPSLYGIMNDRVGKRAGMFMLMYSTLLGIVLSACIYIFSLQEKKKLEKQINEDEIKISQNPANQYLI